MRVRARRLPVRSIVVSTLAAASVALCAAGAEAARPKSSFMPVGEAVEPPYGYFDYCHRLQADCMEFAAGTDGQEAVNNSYWDLVFDAAPDSLADDRLASAWAVADLTPEQWRAVQDINHRINREITEASDAAQFGRKDFWAVPLMRRATRQGDCEDYVLAKRRELVAAGVPEGALSIAIGRTNWREVHAVLLIATPGGEFVLDNRSPWISRWYDVSYRWDRRQVPGSKRWARVRV